MLRFPHEPDMSALAARLQETLAYVAGADEQEHAELAERHRQLGALYYSSGSPIEQVVHSLRVSCDLFHEACKAGAEGNAFDLWEAFHNSVAVGSDLTSHFIASLPAETWIESDFPPWPVAQCLTAFALFREEEARLPRLLEQLRAFVLEEPLPEEFAAFVPETQNSYHLLQALHDRNGAEFQKRLTQRMDIRAKIYRDDLRDDPEGLLDLPGLGLCRLARSRGMRPEVKHVYLPLQLLEVPWSPHPENR